MEGLHPENSGEKIDVRGTLVVDREVPVETELHAS
jgi:hypothetical protein